MAKRVVVTGGGGFVGQWMARALLARGDEVILSGLGVEPPQSPAILTPAEWRAVKWMPGDVRRDDDLTNLLETSPDLVVHLAGISHVPDAEQAPVAAYEINVVGAVRLLTAAVNRRKRTGHHPVFLIVGSGTQYGRHPDSTMPLTESAEQRPLNAYASTKAAQEICALQIARTKELRVICTRSFSHSGVGHESVFLLPSLLRRVRELPKSGGTLRIGNDVVRDYLHVDDAISAYLALAEHGKTGEAYNVASGIPITVRELARSVIDAAGVDAEVVSDPELQRLADMPVLVGSPAKLMADTGWRPEKTYRDIIADLVAASG
jgi:GDP-4-dehydro-6-deoxy-D-mannose reductase